MYELRERKKQRLLTDHLELHMLELPKFKQELAEVRDDAARWLYFLKHGDKMSAAEVKKLGLPEIAEADRKLQGISQDEKVRIQHMRWEKAIRDRDSFGPDWKEEGRKEGLVEGERKGEEKALRRTIADLCGVLGIELTPRRRQSLQKLDQSGLSALWDHLKTKRSWPT